MTKRPHVDPNVDDRAESVRFHGALLGVPPYQRHGDRAEWRPCDLPIDLAPTARGGAAGVDHLGIEAGDAAGLAAMRERPRGGGRPSPDETSTIRCYARPDESSAVDPQGVARECFLTHGPAGTCGEDGALSTLRAQQCRGGAGGCA